MKAMFFLCLLIFSTNANAQDVLPDGWHLNLESRANSVNCDFNGSGHPERAVLITDGYNSMVAAFIYDKGKMSVVSLFDTIHEPSALTLKMVPPGEYKTACGKKYYGCSPDESESVHINRPAISFADENVEILFVFDGGAVKKIWLSD